MHKLVIYMSNGITLTLNFDTYRFAHNAAKAVLKSKSDFDEIIIRDEHNRIVWPIR